MKVFIKGLNSCIMRKQKLQQYHDFLVANGHEISSDPHNSDAIIMWTCAFRADVRDNSLTQIQQYQQQYNAELIVAGCLPDIAPDLLQENFAGHIINWRDDKNKMEAFFGCTNLRFDQVSTVYAEEKLCDNAEKYRQDNPDKDATFYDQFIKLVVAEGCRFNCSYCSERLAFPSFHSFPEDRLIEACRHLVEETKQLEVILLADSLGNYGSDIGSNLPTLIHKLKTIHPDLKFALNNLNPVSFIQYYNDMVEFLHNGNLQHLNLPIQSASPHILKLMKRGYTRKDLDKIFTLLNSIGFTRFDTHVIIGFPGETEEDVEETIQFILQHRPSYVLLNSFMESPRMSATSLPSKVCEETKHQRMHKAEAVIKATGIICNADDSKLSTERYHRLNLKRR